MLWVSLRSTRPAISAMTVHLKRRGAEQLPAVALQHVGPLRLAHRGEIALDPMLLLDQPARLGRRIKKQYPAGRGAAALPGMRHIARHEGAGARAADRHFIADQEGDLTLQHISEFIAVVVEV